jgi:hypothetical protein
MGTLALKTVSNLSSSTASKGSIALVKPARLAGAREQTAFPEARTRPALSTNLRDEILEFYAFVFCQGGFRQLGLTFEQFLLVAAAIKPADFRLEAA